MLTLKEHLALLAMSFLTWGFFVLVGWPDYYQSWPLWAKVAIVIAVTLAYFPLTAWLVRLFGPRNSPWVNSLWLALYLTLPLFLYDYVLICRLGGEDWGFLGRYWYLSFFYGSFWVQMPLVGWWMTRAPRSVTEGSSAHDL